MSDSRPVFSFDIDNCVGDVLGRDTVGKRLTSSTQLYSRSRKVHEITTMLNHTFIKNALSLDDDATRELHQKYRKECSLILQGLVQNHGIDPLELLVPDPELCQMLRDIDKTKVKLWLLTNAYVNHGRRVVRLLGIEDHFEGLTYCDYAAEPIHCKPHVEMFNKAMREAGVGDVKACHFVDDSAGHCFSAEKFGWTAVHLLEDDAQPLEADVCKYRIARLVELRNLFPHFFIGHGTGI
ncbi:HAD-like domain-containing protein [Dichotomopilus funicola]|uniref:HAD-like domain-containing protein n=1 Tax=Dichotomopilus funicola TaxID=1934379 RepID=A0AAN6ZR28_9PEZI|nr:HAD-like domain-containing protein [Dichotomopilus funicola]